LATATARETGITCDECLAEFTLGTEYVYWYGRKLHQRCASLAAAEHREQDDDPVEKARVLLESKARVVLSRSQLRALVALAVEKGLEPVRKPDSGRQVWYGRMSGWSAARVNAGLAASEVAGMWSDFLDAGRVPPLRRCDLVILMDVVDPQETYS
jgi:anti-sigma factor RsiW